MIQRISEDTLLIDGVEVQYTAETETRTTTRNGADLRMGEVVEWEEDYEYEFVLSIETDPQVGLREEREIIEFLNEENDI
jgi:hypothetical protein